MLHFGHNVTEHYQLRFKHSSMIVCFWLPLLVPSVTDMCIFLEMGQTVQVE